MGYGDRHWQRERLQSGAEYGLVTKVGEINGCRLIDRQGVKWRCFAVSQGQLSKYEQGSSEIGAAVLPDFRLIRCVNSSA